MEITLDQNNFESEVVQSTLPVLVDFWAPWCGPCHVIAPAVSSLASEFIGRLKVGKLNVDENPGLAERYGVRSIPNLKIFLGGKVVDEIVGAVPKSDMQKRVEKYLPK